MFLQILLSDLLREDSTEVTAVTRNHGWNDGEKVLWLRVALKGKARVLFKQLSHETQKSYSASMSALRDRFEPYNKRELNFQSRVNHNEENWANFGDD